MRRERGSDIVGTCAEAALQSDLERHPIIAIRGISDPTLFEGPSREAGLGRHRDPTLTDDLLDTLPETPDL